MDKSVNMLFGSTFPLLPSDFLPRPPSSSSGSWDQMIQSSRHLLFLVIFGKVVTCWSWVHTFSPSGDSVPSGPAPLALAIKCLHAREFFCRVSFKLTFPRRALVVCVVGPLVWTIQSDMSLLSAVVATSCFALHLCLCVCFQWPLSLSLYQSSLLPLEPLLPPFFPPSSLLPLAHSSAPFPRYHVTAPYGPFLPATLPVLYRFQAIAHTSSHVMALLASWSHCVVFASCERFPGPLAQVRRRPSFR